MTMTRNEILTALMIHTVESIDGEGVMISHQQRRDADQHLEGDQVGTPSESILARAQALLMPLRENAPFLVNLTQTLTDFNTTILTILCTISLLLGFGLHSLGEDRYFHILSPVLIGILIWNLMSIALLLWGRYTPSALSSSSSDVRDHSTYEDVTSRQAWRSATLWLQNKWYRFILKASPNTPLQMAILRVYLQKSFIFTQTQITAELRRCLHLMSVAFLLGALGSAYWDGLIHQYVASAESTFLNRTQVEDLLSILFWPSTIMGYGAVSLADFTIDPQHKILVGTAAPWIHRYTISLLVWIAVPRLILIMLETLAIWKSTLQLPIKLSWLESVPTLNLGLASHTNIGKTSLARTLLKRDVGVIRDEKHVTQARSSYFLINAPNARIRLWDTPGFGALKTNTSANQNQDLESRLEKEAVNALRDEADVILYLVPAWPMAEQITQAHNELTLLFTLNKPILLLINRLYDQDDQAHPKSKIAFSQNEPRQASIELWKAFLSDIKPPSSPYQLIVLDAFERLLNDERTFFNVLVELTISEQKQVAQNALQVWEEAYISLLEALSSKVVTCLKRLLKLKVDLPSKGKKHKESSIQALHQKTEEILRDTFDEILDCLGLKGDLRENIFQHSLETSVIRTNKVEKRKWGAIVGSALSGLSTGLAADVMSGGLSLGGGMILGAILGAVGGAGVVEGYERLSDSERELHLSVEAIYILSKQLTLFTLSASKHGRARGAFEGHENSIEHTSEDVVIQTLRSQCIRVTQHLEADDKDKLMEALALTRTLAEGNELNGTDQLQTLVTQRFSKGLKLM
jgi:hypothetical protein